LKSKALFSAVNKTKTSTSIMTTEQEMENSGDPVYTDNSNTLNPLKMLMEGFCSPKKMMASNHYGDEDDVDDEDGDDRTADKYAPDLAPSQTTQIPTHEEEKGAEHGIGLTENDHQDKNNGTDEVGTIKSNSPKVISELTTDGLTTNDTSKAPTNPSPTSTDTTTATTTTTTTTTTKQESRPEIEVSKRVTMMRRKRGIENFIMACIFVLTTLLSLKKLGFTTTDFGDFVSIVGGGGDNNSDDAGSSSSSSKSWIHIFDKKLLSIEKGKFEVKKLVTTTTTTEEQPSIDETETPPESVPAAEEKDKIEEKNDTEDDSYDDDDEEEY
jgi:hypothetical protein